MPLNRERITLNPYEESGANIPLELGGDRFGHGVFIQPGGSTWAPAAETLHAAESADTEGGLVASTSIGFRQSPVLRIQVVEPTDPADTNYVLNPQLVVAGVGPSTQNYSSNAATGGFSLQQVRDLTCYDYALLHVNPGTNANEGVAAGVGNIPLLNTPGTFGVWLKGVNGGEGVKLSITETGPGTTTSATVALTTQWQFYTVTKANWTTGTAGTLVVSASTIAAQSLYSTGWCFVQNSSLTEGFDGTFPGCAWTGQPGSSTSTRPSTGGPRLDAIMADLERQVTMISRTRSGTIRRTTPAQAGRNFRVTYDLVNAQLAWDDTSEMNAGVAKGTITCTAEPYGRGPEMTTVTDSFFPIISSSYITDAGALGNFTGTVSGLSAASNLATENRFLSVASPYPVYSGEAQASFTPGATISGFKGGVIIERSSSSTYIEGYVTDNGVNSFLKIDKVIAGSRVNVQSTTLAARIVNGTPFTVRLRLQRVNSSDLVYAEYFAGTLAPTATTAPTNAPASSIIADSVFNALTPGLAGVVFTPQTAGATCTKLIISPYLARERTLPVLRFGLCGVPGSAPALGRMVIQDDSGSDQYWVRWGLQTDRVSRFAGVQFDLFQEAENLTPINGAAVAAQAGASGSGNNVVLSAGLTTTPGGVLTTQLTGGGAQLAHIGSFEVWARVLVPSAAAGVESIQLQWSAGDLLSWTSNAAVTPAGAKGTFSLVSLGTIRIPTATAGAQQWQGRVLASSTAPGDTIAVDCLFLVPLDAGAATAQGVAPSSLIVPAFSGRDEFNQAGTLFALTGQTAPVGGNWATSGTATTDYQINNSAGHYVQRAGPTDGSAAAVGGRFALLGAGTLAGLQASVDTSNNGPGASCYGGLALRYVNSTNYMVVVVTAQTSTGAGATQQALVFKVIAGAATLLGTTALVSVAAYSAAGAQQTTLKVTVDAAGRWAVYLGPVGAATLLLRGSDPVLAVGGTLASGQYGFYGMANSTNAQWDNFWIGAMTTDAAFFNGKQLEVRADRANRQDAAGTIWTPPSSYMGSYMRVPNPQYDDGVANLLVKGSRNDPAIMSDAAIDAVEAQVSVTPRYAQIPDA